MRRRGEDVTHKELLSLTLILLLILLLSTSPDAKAVASVSVSPAELHIEMSGGYPSYIPPGTLKVTNPYNTSIQVSAKVVSPWDLRENYITMPNLSWVNVSPQILDVPAKSSNVFNLSIQIPDNEKPLHYNESWEVWIYIIPYLSSDFNNTGQIGVGFQVQYMVRILIKTPPGEMGMQTPKDYYIFSIIFMLLIGIPIILFIVKNIVTKKKIGADKKSTIFYFKKENS